MELRGNLRDFSFPDIIQLVGFGRKTGVLRVDCAEGGAAVFFDRGAIIHAEFPGTRGPEAVYRLFRAAEGEFHFQKEVAAPDRTISMDPTNLLMEAARLLDESRREDVPGSASTGENGGGPDELRWDEAFPARAEGEDQQGSEEPQTAEAGVSPCGEDGGDAWDEPARESLFDAHADGGSDSPVEDFREEGTPGTAASGENGRGLDGLRWEELIEASSEGDGACGSDEHEPLDAPVASVGGGGEGPDGPRRGEALETDRGEGNGRGLGGVPGDHPPELGSPVPHEEAEEPIQEVVCRAEICGESREVVAESCGAETSGDTSGDESGANARGASSGRPRDPRAAKQAIRALVRKRFGRQSRRLEQAVDRCGDSVEELLDLAERMEKYVKIFIDSEAASSVGRELRSLAGGTSSSS